MSDPIGASAALGGNGGGEPQGGAPQGGAPQGGAPEGGGQANPATDWAGSLNEENKAWADAKGFKEINGVFDSLRNAERVIGADRMGRTVVLPKPDADEKAMGEFYNSLGRPETADGYKFNPGEKPDEKMLGWAKPAFHKAGLTDKQAQILTDEWNGHLASELEQHDKDYKAGIAADDLALRQEWGAAYDANMQAGRTAAARFGITGEEIDAFEGAFGYARVMKVFSDIGKAIGEDTSKDDPNDGRGMQGAMTPAEAQAEWTRVRDENIKVYKDKSHPDYPALRQRLDRLAGMAWPQQ